MFAPRPTLRDRNRRRGSAVVETIIFLPLILLVIFGMVGLTDMLITEQVLSEASARGARTAAMGGSDEQIAASVLAVLGPNRSRNVSISVGSPTGEPGPVPPGGLIEVRVEVKARDATATTLFPLRADDTLVGRTVMQKE